MPTYTDLTKNNTFTDGQATKLTKLFSQLVTKEYFKEYLKEQLGLLRKEIADNRESSKKDLHNETSYIRHEVDLLRKDMEIGNKDLKLTIYGVAITMTGVIITAIKYL